MEYLLFVPVVCFFSWFCCMVYRYRNPYKLVMVFGKKGSGKTTLLTKLALQSLKRGYEVYSTVDVPGCHTFDVNLVGKYVFPPDSVVLIDEVGMIWDNRDYKKFRTDVRDYFKLQRHYRNTVYLFSQTFDVDVKLRNLTDAMYLCTSYFGFISVARKIRRMITIVNPQGDSESRIADSMEFVPLWKSLFGAGSVRLTYIPRWSRYFDSHEVPALPLVKGSLRPPAPCVSFFRDSLPSVLNALTTFFRKTGCSVLASARRWWGSLRHPHH